MFIIAEGLVDSLLFMSLLFYGLLVELLWKDYGLNNEWGLIEGDVKL